jgi:serine/threonine-protein kinase
VTSTITLGAPGPRNDEIGEVSTFSETLLRPSPEGPALPPGLRIGPYEIERELGSGGMGTVYLASRADEAFEKKVAIKVVRGALGSAEAVERFKRERQILAHLAHPNIGRLLDGGATPEGLPYLVMDYIEGEPLHVYCDRKRLSTVERLKLFLEVASAVEYAHRELVIHRDLKPANILVTEDSVPHLLDFGIAKLLDAETDPGGVANTVIAFTPWYASPEQVRGEPMATATDIYSLGVLLYELLTGHGPYRLATGKPLEVLRAIVEQEPELPSAAVDRTLRLPSSEAGRAAALTPSSVSRTREGTPQRLRSRLRGDLDAILMTALRKEPERRYPSVAAFAADVRAYIEGRPISARRDSVLYRTGKFVKRNRWGVAAGIAILGLGIGMVVSTLVQSRRLANERDRAARIQKFLVDLFSVSDPGEARGNSVTAREVLDRGAERIRSELEAQPEARADLMETMADIYNRLGLNHRAEELGREALLYRREARDRDPRALASSLNLLGSILMDKGDAAESEAVYREALALRRRLFGNESLEVAQTLNNLAGVLHTLGRFEESDRLQAESLQIKRKLLDPSDPSLASSVYNLGIGLYQQGDLAGAEARIREALDIQRRALGPDHPEVAFTMQSLGALFDETGRYEEAEAIYREALAIQRKVLGDEHPDIVTTLTNLANTLTHESRLVEAEQTLREALPMSRKLYGEETPDTAHVLAALGDLQLQRGRLEEALRDSIAAQTICEKILGLEHPQTAEAQALHGRVLLAMGRYEEAEKELRPALERLESQPGPEAIRTGTRDALVQLYEKWGKPDEASRYRR